MEKYHVLDKGFISVVDSMGSDDRIVQAARVSYGDGTKTKRDDEKLIKYLLINNHWSPFEHCLLTIHVKCPLFIRSQWFRHRSWSFNEVSARYSKVKEEFYIPSECRGQSSKNKQCSEGVINEITHDFYDDPLDLYIAACEASIDTYNSFIESGISREMARAILPQSMYTEFYATANLRSILHFIELRNHEHAQYEIRVYAQQLKNIIENWCPLVHNAYVLSKLTSNSTLYSPSLEQLSNNKNNI